MGSFNESEYYQILRVSIRANVVIPFDCFLLLKVNQRIVHFIHKGDIFDKDKLEQLKSFRYKNLYIHIRDMEAYEQYLRSFFESEEGKKLIEEQKQNPSDPPLAGISEKMAKEFGIPIVPTEKAEAPAEPVKEEVVKSEKEGEVEKKGEGDAPIGEVKEKVEGSTEDDGKVTVVEEPPAPDESAVKVLDTSEARNELVKRLVKNVHFLDESLDVKGALAEEDQQVISAATDRINDALTHVKGLKDEGADGNDTRIKDITQQINEDITKIEDIAKSKKGERYEQVGKNVQALRNQVMIFDRDFVQPKKGTSKLGPNGMPASLQEVYDETWKLKQLAKNNEKDVLSSAVDGMIDGIQKMIGKSLDLTTVGGASDQLNSMQKTLLGEIVSKTSQLHTQIKGHPEAASLFLSPIQEIAQKLNQLLIGSLDTVVPATPPATEAVTLSNAELERLKDSNKALTQNPKLAEHLNEIILTQNQTIMDLQNRLTFLQKVVGGVRERWNDFKTQVQPRMDKQNERSAERLNLELQEFENNFIGAHQSSNNLVKISNQLSELAGVDPAKKPQLMISDSSSSTSAATEATAPPTTIDLPDSTEGSQNLDEVKSENRILRSQLENAQAFINSNEKKLAEITKLLNVNDEYIGSLENEIKETKANNNLLSEKAVTMQEQQERAIGQISDHDRVLQTQKAIQDKHEETIYSLRDRVLLLEKNLESYKTLFGDLNLDDPAVIEKLKSGPLSPEAVALIETKERTIRKLQEQAEEKREKFLELQKETFKLQSKLGGITQLKQRISKEVDKMKMEKEDSRRMEQVMGRKVATLQNLLDESRKSVNKLTAVNDELRKDRVDYMAKTNKVLKDFKYMLNKANSLNNHVQAEIQRNQNLNDQNEFMKKQNRELATKVNDADKKIKELEAQLRMVKKSSGGSAAA